MPIQEDNRNAAPEAATSVNGANGRERNGEPKPRRERFPGGAPMAPQSEVPGMDALVKWGSRTLEEVKSFGRRVFVHLAAIVCGAAVAASSGSLLHGLCVYVGAVCIVARGMAARPAWLVPAGAGIVQTVLLALFGLPLPQALFWGGAQSWLQRLLQKRLRMGVEWGMLLVLLPLGIFLLDTMPVLPLAGSFAGVAVAAGLVTRAANAREAAAARAEELRRQGTPEPPRVAAYRESLTDFLAKVAGLPPSVRGFGESIAVSAGNILDCMAADARDLEPGHRFLNRYFKAAHSVVEKHLSLSRERVITREITDALEKSREMLIRLDEVFAKEHGRLLANDVTDFSADLAVIDTLLKMDGR